ncbi:hypothetical protein B0H12DRAFT_1141397 [Mycena haematopus]|nr:hypothetical protein B0H12DRAFT_1141397 [Mycena haematopus]
MRKQEELFFVKQITQAKVYNEKTRRRNKKIWHYRTVWEGYDDITWEPIESFNGTKYAVRLFWANADCGPRNPNQISKFSSGEIIHLKQSSSKVRKTKKPGPGRSSVGLITGTRVFALWPETQQYYSGVVQKRSGAGSYVIRFDEDESEFTVPLTHMRPCTELRKGDTVVLKTDNAVVSELRDDGTVMVKKSVNCSNIAISAYDVDEQWDDRMLAHSDIVCASEK